MIRAWPVAALLLALPIGFWLVGGDSVSASDRGLLAPLAPLEGTWTDGSGETRSFVWAEAEQGLVESRRSTEGSLLETTTYFWHPDRNEGAGSLALVGIASDGAVREGILRQDPDAGLELRFNSFAVEGGGGSFRERLRWLDDGRMLRTLHQRGGDSEILVAEEILEPVK